MSLNPNTKGAVPSSIPLRKGGFPIYIQFGGGACQNLTNLLKKIGLEPCVRDQHGQQISLKFGKPTQTDSQWKLGPLRAGVASFPGSSPAFCCIVYKKKKRRELEPGRFDHVCDNVLPHIVHHCACDQIVQAQARLGSLSVFCRVCDKMLGRSLRTGLGRWSLTLQVKFN